MGGKDRAHEVAGQEGLWQLGTIHCFLLFFMVRCVSWDQ